MNKSLLIVFISVMFICLSLQSAPAADKFYAYYTKVQQSATDYLGKYPDIIVVMEEGKQLEFTRQTGYQPLWKTPSGSFLVDDLFPARDKDYEFNYTYVRLIEENDDKIVVHWRYFPDIQILTQANRELNPMIPQGFLGVVHEIFIIKPDGTVEREIKEAKGTNSEQWINPNLATKQTLKLMDDGIDHGKVKWGGPRWGEPPQVEGRKIVEVSGLPKPQVWWKFDEALDEPEGLVIDDMREMEGRIEGFMTVYKKGVSGTCLAFDGYYTGATFQEDLPKFRDAMSIEGWVALDVYPYNNAPIVHHSKGFGKEGYYLGINPYGKPFIKLNGVEVKAPEKISLLQWHHVAATAGDDEIHLFVDGKKVASGDFEGKITTPDMFLKIGLNTELERCTDYVRSPDQNLLFLFGIQGVLDELKIYSSQLSDDDVSKIYAAFKPTDKKSPIDIGVLPGELGKAKKFGAYYKTLPFQELWDNMWRSSNYSDIVIKFEDLPTSVVYWRGSNFAANWVTDNNRWMADQSSEIFTKHGCSEHMADKQLRHSYARIIENSSARVVIHWRYPCVDVSYFCADRRNWSDEYHTIYPDGTGIRKVVWNRGYNSPGFQDIQFFTNPGESALDVMNLDAMSVANVDGDVQKLTWKAPNHIPKITIDNATIEWLNSKSKYKVFTIFQGGNITPWGEREQSKYTDDPFAGPWNHWPMHFVPSDGRFAVDTDRVTHFAIGANDYTPEFGSMVHYGFTDQPIETLIPVAKFWQNPPEVEDVTGAKSMGFSKDDKSFIFKLEEKKMSFRIDASKDGPVINPCFVIKQWPEKTGAVIKVDGTVRKQGKKVREGFARCHAGHLAKVIWLEMNSEKPISVEIAAVE
jgi:hypothetical protein